MDWKTWAPFGTAAVLGSAAAYVGYVGFTGPAATPQAEGPKMALVAAAARAVPAGSRLTPDDLTLLRVDSKSMVVGAETIGNLDEAAGRVVNTKLAPGQPLRREDLLDPQSLAGLSALLPKGYRAVTIDVNEYAGLRGLLRPEARVDVVVTLRATGDGETLTRTVAQDLRVLAVSGRTEGQTETPAGQNSREDMAVTRGVTLMVTPEQAHAIDLAGEMASPRLVLRAGGDHDLHPFDGMTLADLRGDDPLSRWEGFDPFAYEPAAREATVPTSAAPDAAADPAGPADATGEPALPSVSTPAPAPTRLPRPSTHVVEVIRGGVITREAVHPAASGTRRPDGPTTQPVRRPRPDPQTAVVGVDVTPAD